MADSSIDKIVLDAQLAQNKEKLNELSNNSELNNDVQQALKAVGLVMNGKEDQEIVVSKIEQGKGEFSNYIDMEFTSKDGVATVSLNDSEWKVKSSLDDVQYSGAISDYKELNKTFDGSIVDYDRIEKELNQAPNLENVETKIIDNSIQFSNEPEIEKKDYKEVLNDASQNWHKNDLEDFKDISKYLVAEHDAKVMGNYNVANMEINLTVHNSVDQPLFEIHSTKMGRDIDVVGLHTNEEFSYSKNDGMSVDLIKQQYSIEAIELGQKALEIHAQKDAAEIALEQNFSSENLAKFESLEAQYDAAVQRNSIEFSQEPEQTYNLNFNYNVPSQGINDAPVETPVSMEQTVTETPSIRNDQNAAIPEQVEHVEPNLTETTTTTSKTDIEQQAPQAKSDIQDKGANLDKVGYEVPQSVSSDFVHTPSDSAFKSSKYYEKSNPVAVAFEDRGKLLSSSREDNKTIGAMVAVAKSKNWNEIQVKGTEEFKRKAWLEAASQGIKVKGFKPTERDMAALQAKQEEMSRNQIQHVPQREQQAQTQVKTSHEVKTEHNPNFKEHEQAKIITARRILEESMKKQDKSPSDMEKAMKAFDQMTKNPENVQKLVAAQTKQTKEIEHQKSASQERSR